ncbi:hypothetical protein TB2_028259 [Malus domestica]
MFSDVDSSSNSVMQVMTTRVTSIDEQLAQMNEVITRLTWNVEEKDLQVLKKSGQIHVCVTFQDLNDAYPKDDFPLPIIEIMVDATIGHEALSFMDGSSGYNQIRMALEDQELTAFRTPKGIYCYKVMPFGLKNAGAIHQRAMQKIFNDMLHKT